jgi:site-specific DNA-methyltransferase (adenine-specific)/modification methylase
MTIIKEERIGGQRLILGDCLKVMPLLGKVDAVVTDPPYGINLNTDNSRFSGGDATSAARRGSGAGPANGKPIANDAAPFDPRPVLAAAKQHIVWGWNNYPDKLPAGSCLVWIKRNDEAFGSFLSDAELAWMSKGHGVYCRRDLTNNGIARQRQHPTQKPLALMEWCLGFLPNAQTILDPFMGSGTTLVACQRLGRNGTGIELDPEYFAIACKRVDEATRQPDLFVAAPPTKPVQEGFDI